MHMTVHTKGGLKGSERGLRGSGGTLYIARALLPAAAHAATNAHKHSFAARAHTIIDDGRAAQTTLFLLM